MTPASSPPDLGFFSCWRAGSLSAAARELGITTPAVSKRLAQMEARLGVQLVNRTTRRMASRPKASCTWTHARRILAEIDDMEQLVTRAVAAPKGLLRVNATLGFRAQPCGAADLALRPQGSPAGGGAAAAVGQPAAADRRRL
jgi:LysR family transcriptional activator of dmlA